MTKFWKLFLLIFICTIALGCSDNDNNNSNITDEKDEEITIDAKPGMNLVGKISAGETPVVGAVVSDGYTVGTTDSEGIYQLKANLDSASFVFVSVPAEYEIPLDANGIPQMYKNISALRFGDKKVVQRDFTLVKTAKKSKFTLVAMADVQIENAADFALLQKEIPLIKEYVETIGQPVYGISLGDLVWDNMPFLGNYRNEISKLGMPVFQVVGNHDHDKNVVNNDLNATQQYERFFGPTHYSYNIGDCHFVVLDDVYYGGGADKVYNAQITTSQLNWLKQDLSHVTKDKLIILGTHIPTKRRMSSSQVTNNAALYKLLEGYKVRILSGHSHHNYTTTISADIEENTHGAVMGEFWTGAFCSDGSPKGYSVYEVNGNQISNWYYKGTEKDKNYQMRLYTPGSSVTTAYAKDVLINIFTWHTNWTVKVTEDNNTPVILTKNIKEYDRPAYDFLGGYGDDKKPSIRSTFAEAIQTDHIFNYTPKSDAWKKITVEATDPYGNVYTETLSLVLFDDFSWITTGPNYLGGTGSGGEVRFDVVADVVQKEALKQSGWGWDNTDKYIYMHNGYVKLGTSKLYGVIVSPALADIKNTEDVVVSFDASRYQTSSTAAIDAEFDVIFKIVEGEGTIDNKTSKSASVPLTGAGVNMQKCSFTIYGASATTKFSIQNGTSTTSAARMFLDNMKVARK